MQLMGDLTKSISLKSRFSNHSHPQERFFIITYCRCEGALTRLNFKIGNFDFFSILNSLFLPKMEILTLFSILNSFFLPKLEILTVFSILNSFFLPKLEILTLFSILNSLFLTKLEILTVFSILNSLFLLKMEISTFFPFCLIKNLGNYEPTRQNRFSSHSLFPDFLFLYI